MTGRVRRMIAALAGASVLAGSLAVVVAPAVSAATCSVTNASTGVRFGSLQSAVNAAAPGVTLRISGSCKGNVAIGKRLTLLGTGTAPTLRGDNGRPLTITAGPVTLDRLRITGGLASDCFGAPAGVACGGGVLSSARLIVKRSLIDANIVDGSDAASGGGITVATGGSLKVTGSTIAQNSALADASTGTAEGGGIAVAGSATITGSSIEDNVASGDIADGGGILADPGAGALTLTQVTVAGNTALGGSTSNGGGVKVTTTLRMTASTIAGNTASGTNTGFSVATGGGVMAPSGAIANSTFSGNTASSAGLAVGGAHAGGLWISDGSIIATTIAGNTAITGGGAELGGSVEVGTTIIAGNSGQAGARDCVSVGGTTTAGRNLIGDGTGCATFVNGVKGDKVGTAGTPIAPKLAPLANNGGPTQTRALKAGSPAIDAGGSAPCSTVRDQRGVARPKGARCDIGAFEKG